VRDRRHLRIGPLRVLTSGPADFALLVANGAHLRALLERFPDAQLSEVHDLEGDALLALLAWEEKP
jgi:hypothetical protein